ncbi:MAG: hypothetical protein R6V85_06775 [Polyangia bacterium]
MQIEGKRILFAVLNAVQGLLVGAIPLLVPSRSEAINAVLWAVAAASLLAAPAILLSGGWGRWVAAAACLANWLTGLAFAALTAWSASYLYGIYGRHGHAVGSIAFVIAGVVLILFWLIPLHELHYLARGSGRGAAGKARPAGEGGGES